MGAESIRAGDTGWRQSWWREAEVLVLLALVAVAYWVRIGDLSMRGEEPRRAQVAFEILERGDWIVPRQQGETYLSRPPLQNWVIAVSTVLCGSREPWAVRLPSVLAMLLTTWLIYGYARTCLGRPAALAAAIAFCTFGEMFTTGCQAETEMLFIALTAGSLLLWHWGQVQNWSPTLTWSVSYALVGLGFLCKGPQTPVYFGAAVGSYLLITGQWRRLFTWAHLAGLAVGGVIVFAWLIPCAYLTSLPETWGIFMKNTSMRLRDWQFLQVFKHMVEFPFEVLGCTMPWSLLLVGFVSRPLRRSVAAASPQTLFMGLCAVCAFPTCWIPPGGQTRYFAPLYPCLAVLVGVVIECCMRADVPVVVRNGWRRYVTVLAAAMVALAVGVVGASFLLPNHRLLGSWAEKPLIALGYGVLAVVLAGLTMKCRQAGDPVRVRQAVLAAAGFMVLTCTGYMTNVRIRASVDQATPMAELKAKLPRGQRLVSFDHVDSLFVYYYGQPIEVVPMPTRPSDLDEDAYFCFRIWDGTRPALPFPWVEVGVVPMDRIRMLPPERAVVVGHRVKTTAPAATPAMPTARVGVAKTPGP